MNFIEKLSNISAKWLAKKVPNDKYPTVEDQIEVYTYSISGFYGTTLQIVLLIFLALIFKTLTPVIFIAFTFSSFRIIGAGGYHFNSIEKCTNISLIQFIGVGLIINYTHSCWSFKSLCYLFGFCIIMAVYSIYRYIPRDTPNKLITDLLERYKFKRWSLYYLLTWAILMITFITLDLKIIVISSCFGLLLELFSISKLGYGVYEKIDKLLESHKSETNLEH